MKVPEEALPNARPVDQYVALLACPYCKRDITWGRPSTLACVECRRTFDVVRNIPIFLPASLIGGNAWETWKRLEDHYEAFYKRWSKERHLSAQPVYTAFYDWCGIRESQGVSVLDVGGANGIHRVIHWKYPESIDYFNLDPSIHFLHPYHLELYPKDRELDFPYIVGLGEHLPFKPNTFDICVTTAAIDHCSDPVSVFHEIYRCLKPNKSLYVMVRKHGAPLRAGPTKKLPRRISDYYRGHGLLGTAKKMAARTLVLPRLIGQRTKDTHVHHFQSLKELTDLLYMFNVVKTKEAHPAGRTLFFVECRKE
jgi:SAM-dependent methyltransferase